VSGVDFAIAVLLLLGVMVHVLARQIRILKPCEQGVLIRFGAFQRLLNPGFHFISPFSRLYRVDLRPKSEHIGPVTVPSHEGSPITVTCHVEYRVTDAKKSVFETPDLAEGVRSMIQESVSLAVSARPAAEILPKGGSIAEAARAGLAERGTKLGLTFDVVRLTLTGPSGAAEFVAGPAPRG